MRADQRLEWFSRTAIDAGITLLAVATHAHIDHSGGMHEFEHRAIHSSEAESLATAHESIPLDVGRYDDATLDAIADVGYDIRSGLLTEIPHAGFDLTTHELRATTATILLEEGDVIDLGDRAFEVLHLPGHSPGSIGLYDAKAICCSAAMLSMTGPFWMNSKAATSKSMLPPWHG